MVRERKNKEERERKKKEKNEEREKKQEREKARKVRERKKKEQEKKEERKKEPKKDRLKRVSVTELQDSFSNLIINESEDSGDESEADCPWCGLVYGSADDNEKWVQCDKRT